MQLPAESSQHALPQLVAVAGGRGVPVASAVALDAQEVAARVLRIDDGQVDAIARAADAVADLQAVTLEGRGPLLLEGAAVLGLLGAGVLEVQALLSVLRELQEALEVAHPGAAGPVEVDLVRGQGREDQHLPPGAGDGHVQPAPAALAVQGAEAHAHAPLLVGPVADREEDHVPLVPLDVLQVLDEDRLQLVAGEEGLDGRVVPAGAVEQVEHEALLGLAQGHHADGVAGELGVLQPAHDLGHDGLGLAAVRAALAVVVDAVGHRPPADSHPVVDGGGERDQPAVVVARVAEGDQALVAAAVVPAEGVGVDLAGDALVQHALQVLGAVLVPLAAVGLAEEAGGGQLLGVADHHQLAAPGNGADGVPDRHLRGLVEDDDVEGRQGGVEELGHREGAHEQARPQLADQVAGLPEEGADRLVAALLLDLPAQEAALHAVAQLLAAGAGGVDAGTHRVPGGDQELVVELAEALDGALVVGALEVGQQRVTGDHVQVPLLAVAALEGGQQLGVVEPSLLEGRHQHLHPGGDGRAAGGAVATPLADAGPAGRPALEALEAGSSFEVGPYGSLFAALAGVLAGGQLLGHRAGGGGRGLEPGGELPQDRGEPGGKTPLGGQEAAPGPEHARCLDAAGWREPRGQGAQGGRGLEAPLHRGGVAALVLPGVRQELPRRAGVLGELALAHPQGAQSLQVGLRALPVGLRARRGGDGIALQPAAPGEEAQQGEAALGGGQLAQEGLLVHLVQWAADALAQGRALRLHRAQGLECLARLAGELHPAGLGEGDGLHVGQLQEVRRELEECAMLGLRRPAAAGEDLLAESCLGCAQGLDGPTGRLDGGEGIPLPEGSEAPLSDAAQGMVGAHRRLGRGPGEAGEGLPGGGELFGGGVHHGLPAQVQEGRIAEGDQPRQHAVDRLAAGARTVQGLHVAVQARAQPVELPGQGVPVAGGLDVGRLQGGGDAVEDVLLAGLLRVQLEAVALEADP